MKCRKVRDFLLTDYLDGELPEGLKKEVDAHLSKCALCREFQDKVIQKTSLPFRDLEELNPEGYILEEIKEKITDIDNDRYSLWARFKGTIFQGFSLRKPSLALVLSIAVIVVSVVFTKLSLDSRQSKINNYISEQLDSIAYLISSEDNSGGEDSFGFGTAVEDYFM